MLRVVPYEPWHLKAIDVEHETKVALLIRYTLADLLKEHAVYTAINDTEVLIIAGIIKLWPGVGEATVYISKKYFDGTLSLKDRIKAAKVIRRYFHLILSNMTFHRVQATVDTSFKRALRFIEYMGFDQEGLAKKFGPDKEDYMRYVMFPEVK